MSFRFCEKISLDKFLPAAWAAADNEHACLPFVNKRRFVSNGAGKAFSDEFTFGFDDGEVQCIGGCGNEFGDGASKYLLPAKCKFGGDIETPAGDANDIGERGELRPLCGLPFW